jgi:DNA-binding MurR/RpiR family transcriptional regulator
VPASSDVRRLAKGGGSAPAARQLSDLFAGHRLTPVQRRIAAHIIAAGSTVAFHSSVELAEQVGVSQPSVTRFATALGYSGFPEFQRAVQALVLDQRSPATPEAGQNKMQRSVQRSIDLLIGVRDDLSDLSLIEEAANLMAASSVLPVYGMRAGQGLASQFQFFASKIHPDARLLSGGRTEALDELAAAAELGATAMLAVAMPRYPRDLFAVLRAARKRFGLKVVLVIDSAVSSLAELGDVVLAAPANTELVFDAAVVPTQILSVMLEALADAFPGRTRERLDQFERRAAEEDYFLDDEYGPSAGGPRVSMLGTRETPSG